MSEKKSEMHFAKIDDIFSTQEERDDAKLEKIREISISEIDDFPEHPFKVTEGAEFNEMLESINKEGVILPAIVRPKADGRYEMISGHRRKKASELLNLDTIPCIVKDLSDDEATIFMVDSNLQRELVLPSEKAFAYKMKMEAISHQGKRNDIDYTLDMNEYGLSSVTLSPMETKLNSAEIIGQKNGDSRPQVFRYIRLTYLIPEILKMVDNDALNNKDELCMAFRPAVEISYLTEEEQKQLLDIMQMNDNTPSLSQAIKFKEMSKEGTLTVDYMEDKMSELKPNQTPKLRVSMNRLSHVLPSTLKNDREREDYVIRAVEFYEEYRKKREERRRRQSLER